MNIIILEDESIIAMNIKQLLLTSNKCITVKTVNNITDFKNALASSPYDIALLDVNLKDGPWGIEAGAFIRKNYQMGIIYITAYSDEQISKQIAENIPDGYLIKPIDETHFINVVNQIAYKYKNKGSLGQISIATTEGEFVSSKLVFQQSLIDQFYICSITDSSGIIVYANEAFCKITGFSRQEIYGKPHGHLNSELHSKEFFAELWMALQNDRVWHGEIKNLTKDNKEIWLDYYIFPLTDKDISEKKYFVCIGNDITEKKFLQARCESILKKKTSELTDVHHKFNRVAKDNSMVGLNSILVHELKRPLAAIFMQTEIILAKHQDEIPEKAKDRLKKFLGNINHILDLIRYLNDSFKRKSTDVKETIDIVAHAKSIIDFTAMIFPIRTPKFEFTTTHEKINVMGYSDAIFLPIFNLLKNSSEAFPDDQTDRLIKISIQRVSNTVNIEISDNKIGGIPEAIALQLFSNSIVSDKKDGTGLGLMVCKQTLGLIDGEIELIKTGDSGTTFQITLPAADQELKSTA
jgi:PAS domain S-box-containing protein